MTKIDPVSLGWTRNIPMQVGYYWAFKPSWGIHPLLVLVDYSGSLENARWFVEWPSRMREALTDACRVELWWHGPIERPYFPEASDDHD